MNQEDSLSESFELDSLISKSTPKRNQQANPAIRTRFSILSDMNEGLLNKKAEEQSLLSRYLKDLHEENLQNAARPNTSEQRNGPNTPVGNLRTEAKENDVNEGNWKKKNGKHLAADPQEDKHQHYESQHLRSSKNVSDSYGIFVYRKKIDLNKPIDFELQEREPSNRIYGESRNSSKQGLRQRSDCFETFGQALSRKKRTGKTNECH